VGPTAQLCEELIYILRNRIDLAGAFSGAYHKVIGERADLACVEQDNIAGLLLRDGIDDSSGSFYGLQN
jgi:hypothetical protein